MKESMTEKELQDLIKLKRYEQPREGYFDAFLTEFQERQRAEMLKTSARGLLLERVRAWFTHISGANKMALGAGCALATVVVVAMTMQYLPETQHENQQQLASHLDVSPADVTGRSAEDIIFHQDGAKPSLVGYEVVREQMIPIDFSQLETHAGPRFTIEQTVF